MIFSIHDTNVNFVNNFVNSSVNSSVTNRIGSSLFKLRAGIDPPVNIVSGISFKLSSQQELTAFSIKQDMWVGSGNTRDCGIYDHTENLVVQATINRGASTLFNGEYFTILSQTVTLKKILDMFWYLL
jgi:hypothetical protein